MKTLGVAGAVLISALLAIAAYVRLAPSDVARWHVDLTAPGYVPPDNAASFCPEPGSRYASTHITSLAALDEIALRWPRTTRLAATETDGALTHVTWITRSAVFGFPDYTTAQIRDWGETRDVCLVARQRFGRLDGGVNAARVKAWTQELLGLAEPPTLGWPRAGE